MSLPLSTSLVIMLMWSSVCTYCYSCCVTVSVCKLQTILCAPLSSYNTDGFPYALCMGLSLIHQIREWVCVWLTLFEWTITKNLLNSCCSLPATICLNSISPFHFQMQRYGLRVSISKLSNSLLSLCQIEHRGVLSQLSPHTGLISHSFRQTTGAYPPQRLMHYTFTSCLISASPPRSATRSNCKYSCHTGAW